MQNWEFEQYESIRKKYISGIKVKALLYKLRHKNITKPQICEVIRCTSDEQIKHGYRFGIIVGYKGKEYWVNPEDCEIISLRASSTEDIKQLTKESFLKLTGVPLDEMPQTDTNGR